MTRSLHHDLKQLVEKEQLVVVVGSGVSVATTENAPTASWTGLLESGLERCRLVGKSEKWAKRETEKLKDAVADGDLVDLLSVAEQVTQHLGASAGEYQRWLTETLDENALPIHNREVIAGIAALNAIILTTNYDDLIERVTGLDGVHWKETPKIRRILRGDHQGVIHLHGLWNAPDSVVLGIREYDEVRDDPHTKAVMQALAITKSLLFVGCGDGLHDPNFGQFLKWLAGVSKADHYRNYRLSRAGEVDQHQAEHHRDQRIFVIPYGDTYDDLPAYLKSMLPTKGSKGRKAPAKPSLSPEIDAHIESLCDAHGKLELIGMGSGVQVNLPISDAYVPLKTCYRSAKQEELVGKFDEKSLQRAVDVERDVKLHEVFTCAGQAKKRGVLLLGDPGAGKTTGARQFCWRLASGEDAPTNLGLPAGTLPVFIRLRNLNPDELQQGLEAFIHQETRIVSDDGEIEVGPTIWRHSGSLVWIFDGMDEIVDETTRREVCQWIVAMLSERQQDRILVTSRYQGYEGKVELGDQFVRFEVQPLDKLTAGAFVHRWYGVVYGCLGLAKDAATEKADSLIEMLDEPDYRVGRIAELRANPLLLTILCLVYHEDSSLPRSRTRLYERCVKVLLETWRQQVHTIRGGRPYDPDAAKQVLAFIAWQLHKLEVRRSIPLRQMEQHAASKLPEYANSLSGMDGQEFIRLMREDSGILAASGSGNAEFLHLTFQEYLAAFYAAQENQATELAGLIEKSWWHEAILLSLAQASRDFSRDFFRAVLSSKRFEQQTDFIQRCVNEAVPFIIEPFLEVLASKQSIRRKTKVLRLLQSRTDPELFEVCGRLASHKNQNLAGLAREILQRADQLEIAAPQVATTTYPTDAFVDQKTGIAFVRIPKGSFMMGDEKWERSKPVHQVTISQDFYLGKYPVTNEEYARFLKATGHGAPEYWSDGRYNQPRQPVVGVSWNDARAFCEWADLMLPTEAQWEYSCRAGSTKAYYFGDDEKQLGEYAWYDANSDGKLQIVGGKQPNDWQLYDMSGNVWEWCQDYIDEAYYQQSPESDPTGPQRANVSWTADKRARVSRGGGWRDVAADCRSGFRYGVDPAVRSRFLGFRVSRLAVPAVA